MGYRLLSRSAVLLLQQHNSHLRYFSSERPLQQNTVAAAYAQLGLSINASADEVKAAYRRLALQCHPDLHQTDSQEFVRITKAYEQIMGKSLVGVPSAGSRRRPGPVVYASLSRSRLGPRAAAIWGFGLFMGCFFFGAVLLWGRAEMIQGSHHRSGPGTSPVVESYPGALKRERIAALLLERKKLSTESDRRK